MITKLSTNPPEEIVFLPEGVHQIHAHTNGKPTHSTVRVEAAKGPQIAASLQRDLDRRQTQNVRPWLDFEHKGGTASALPVAFRYERGKGIMLAVQWTDAGRRAIAGRDYSYFSPMFYLGEDGTPTGIPEKGAIGALVNEPAFRDIPRIAAGSAYSSEQVRDLVAAGDVGEDLLAAMSADDAAYKEYLRGLSADHRQARIAAAQAEPGEPSALEVLNEQLRDAAAQLMRTGEASSIDQGIEMVLRGNPAMGKLYAKLT